jgi:hypothetical protein
VDSEARRAENEATFRRANEDLKGKAQELGLLGRQETPYLCECGEAGCAQVLTLTRAEYEHVRSHPKRFFVVPGHDGVGERVVERNETFSVVEKTGEGGRRVEEQDPRDDERGVGER